MKADFLKKMSKMIPAPALLLFSPLIRNQLIHHPIFLRAMNEIQAFEQLSSDEKNEISLRRLRNALRYAYQHTAFYREEFDQAGLNPDGIQSMEDIKVLPIIDKMILAKNMDAMTSDEKLKYYHSSTGGSTGHTTEFKLDMQSLYWEKAFIYHHWSRMGYDYQQSRLATFRGMVQYWENEIGRFNPVNNEVLLSTVLINRNTIEKYMKYIQRYGASYLHGYPSAIKKFCETLDEMNYVGKIEFKGVMLISETAYDEDRAYIEQLLGVPTSVFYGHTERAVFAEEMDGSYRFNQLYGHTELIPIEGEDNSYDIVCTGYLNHIMPLVRYSTGDTATVVDGKVMIFGHRELETLIGKNNERMALYSFNFNNILLGKFNITNFQFIQTRPGHITIRIIGQPVSAQELFQINNHVKALIHHIMDFDIEFADTQVLSKSGKFSRIINRIEQSC